LVLQSVAVATPPELQKIQVVSSLDRTSQPVMLWAPESAKKKPAPLLVFLHSWSGDYRQNNKAWFDLAAERGWIFLHPNFRGPNLQPEACGSKLARQDVLDSMDHVVKEYQVDPRRIYLAGVSGGGHMAMLMAGYYPDRFTAVSAWVGISDLAAWRIFHTKNGKPARYAQMVDASCGGPPGASAAVIAEYRARSPIFHLPRVGKLPLDINAGVQDGHTGSVPIRHSLNAFNVVAKSHGNPQISAAEIAQLSKDKKLKAPRSSDREEDESYGRELLLRRTSGDARVTIFQGGHESLPAASVAWLQSKVSPSE